MGNIWQGYIDFGEGEQLVTLKENMIFYNQIGAAIIGDAFETVHNIYKELTGKSTRVGSL